MMERTGLAPRGQDDDAVRWVAIRHADDHIHIVATLARQDGRRPSVSNDYYRVREACLAIEQRFGLRCTAPGNRAAARRPTRAETEKAGRRGRREAPRITLKREVSTAAAGASVRRNFQPAGAGWGAGPANGSARVVLARSPGTPSRCPRTAPRPRPGLVRGREAGRGPELAQAPPALGRHSAQALVRLMVLG